MVEGMELATMVVMEGETSGKLLVEFIFCGGNREGGGVCYGGGNHIR
jgi:hypothetical protein